MCSDDPEWVATQPLFKGMATVDATPAQHMAILAACPHMILSVGTFSWWGAYFSKDSGFKIYYSEHNSEAFVLADLYPPSWIGINDAH